MTDTLQAAQAKDARTQRGVADLLYHWAEQDVAIERQRAEWAKYRR